MIFRAFNNPSAGRWGTICNDHYKYETGRVICRSVGFMNIQAKEGFQNILEFYPVYYRR